MANGSSFAALTLARRGVVPTAPSESAVKPAGRIGAVDDVDSISPQADRVVETVAQRRKGFADIAKRDIQDDEVSLPSYSDKQQSPFGKLVPAEERAVNRRARHDMHSMKVLSRLVLAVAHKPGSDAPDAMKSAALTSLLSELNAAVETMFQETGDYENSGWARSQALEGLSEVVAKRWESYTYDEVPDSQLCAKAVAGVLREAKVSDEIGQILDLLEQARYRKATDADVAQQRIEVSSRLAGWDLYEAVMNPRLGEGEYRFTYGKEPSLIVHHLLAGVLQAAKESLPQVDDPDMRTAFFQGGIRRLATLAGAEYVNETRKLMNWIAQEGLSEEEHQGRLARAGTVLESRVIPNVLSRARASYLAIETMAAKLLEKPNASEEISPLARPSES